MHVCGYVCVNAGALNAGAHENKFPSRLEASGPSASAGNQILVLFKRRTLLPVKLPLQSQYN